MQYLEQLIYFVIVTMENCLKLHTKCIPIITKLENIFKVDKKNVVLFFDVEKQSLTLLRLKTFTYVLSIHFTSEKNQQQEEENVVAC